jgi:NADH-quinone oxidoreductase subunit N
MLIFMLSLAGIPPLAGFFGKFYVFGVALNANAANLGLLWLVVVALAMSAVSLYYYLQVLKQIYIVEPGPGTGKLPAPVLSQIAIVLLALAVVVLGCAPNLLLGPLLRAIHAASS